MSAILPSARRVQLQERRALFNERNLRGHDAAIVVCEFEQAEAALARLPAPERWQKLYKEARRRGAVTLLSARASALDVPIVVLFLRATLSAFERLTLAARAWKELASGTPASLLIANMMSDGRGTPEVEAVVAAALAGSAPMPSFKSKPPARTDLARIEVLNAGRGNLQRTLAVDRGNHLARWLTMLPPNVLDADSYRKSLKTLATREGWRYDFYGLTQLKRLKAGAFLAVARSNAHSGAGIVRLRYRPRGSTGKTLALVGKGICFDTGGINLKPHKSMYQMHEDMQGSAVAVGTLLALSELAAPFAIDCWLAITENEIGPLAYRPQEVVTAANGVTIQVVHSDAEGRMVLADTLALASRDQPDLILDYATLTGACVGALTERYSGAFTNHAQLRAAIEDAGQTSGERVWTFPMNEDYDSDLESPVADIMQCTLDSKGDHILAARFLNRFVPAQIPWVHIDLSSSNRTGGLAHVPTEFTGFGVRFGVEMVMENKILKALGARR